MGLEKFSADSAAREEGLGALALDTPWWAVGRSLELGAEVVGENFWLLALGWAGGVFLPFLILVDQTGPMHGGGAFVMGLAGLAHLVILARSQAFLLARGISRESPAPRRGLPRSLALLACSVALWGMAAAFQVPLGAGRRLLAGPELGGILGVSLGWLAWGLLGGTYLRLQSFALHEAWLTGAGPLEALWGSFRISGGILRLLAARVVHLLVVLLAGVLAHLPILPLLAGGGAFGSPAVYLLVLVELALGSVLLAWYLSSWACLHMLWREEIPCDLVA